MMTMAVIQVCLVLWVVCCTFASADQALVRGHGHTAPSSPIRRTTVKCAHKKLDIAILLDSSETVGIENFRIVKTFLADLVAKYHVGRDQTRFGLIVFHDRDPQNTRVEFYLNEYFDRTNLQKRISETVYKLEGVTRMDLAFKYADEKMFTPRNGMRADALQKIFLVTDGMQNPSNNPTRRGQTKAMPSDGVLDHYAIAKKLRDEKAVEIYAIGIGDIDMNELNRLTGDKNKVFFKKDFAALKSEAFLDKLSQFNCIPIPKTCTHKKLDIAILLDASGSIGHSNFDRMKNFLRELIRKYPIDGHPDDATRVSLIVFHNKLPENTRIEFLLNRYSKDRDIENHINNVRYTIKGLTRMDLALDLAYEKVFKEENGMRSDALQKIFLVTDGVQNPSLNATRKGQLKAVPGDGVLDHHALARQLRSNGVEIYAIGIGNDTNIDYNELFSLTGDRGKIFLRKDFDALNNMNFVNKMAQLNCVPIQPTNPPPPPTQPPPPPTQPPPTHDPRPDPIVDCKHKLLDIAVLLDRSGSISGVNFKKMLSFLTELIKNYHVSEDDTHISLTLFSDNAEVGFYLNEFYDKDGLLNEIKKTPYPQRGVRRMDQALFYAEKKVFTTAKGMRNNARQKIFLITDGVQNPSLYPNPDNEKQKQAPAGSGVLDHYAVAQRLRNRNVEIYAIGIGKTDRNELNKLTGDPNKVFAREDFDALLKPEFIRKIMELNCDRITPTSKPKPDPCSGVGRCSSCCSGSDVYNIVFQPNSGPNYIFPRMNQLPPPAKGKRFLVPDGPTYPGNAAAIAAFAKRLTRDSRRQLLNLLLTMDPRTRRRRSIIERGYSGKQTMDKLKILARGSGCGEFLNKLEKDASMREVIDMGKNVAIFCPTDAALKNISRDDLKALLPEHIAVQHGHHGVMFNSLAGGKISLFPSGNNSADLAWKANDINILSSLTDDRGHRILIIDDVIRPKYVGVKDLLKRFDDVSKFYSLLQSSPLHSLVQALNIQKLCFTKTCTTVTPQMEKHLKDVITFEQFTIVVPTDSALESLSETELKELTDNDEKRSEFLKKHIYIRDVRDINDANKFLGFSLSSSHGIATLNKDEEGDALVDAENQLFQVLRGHPVHEGFVYIVDKMK